MSERQQLAEAIRQPHHAVYDLGSKHDVSLIVAMVEPFLVAAERAGYERCKRDASARIDALSPGPPEWTLREYEAAAMFKEDALAVVAALNATQQTASDKEESP